MNRLIFKGIIPLLLLFFTQNLFSQNPVYFDSPGYEFQTAMELFQKEKYGSAQQYFKYVYENTTDKQQDIKSDSYFYMGVCAANLYNNDAIFLLKDFIRKYPVHAFVPEANYYVAKFYFHKKQYKKALEHYEIIDERNVTKEDLAEYYFKRGYCYFETKREEDAKVYFEKARNSEGPYQLRAIYYSACIAYKEGRYQSALEDFLLLRDAAEYREMVPLYLSQIYFLQNRYHELVEIAPPLLDKVSDQNKEELNRIIALSYYNLGKYEESAPYFMNYIPISKKTIDRNDYFAMGFTFYELKEYTKAIEYLSKVTTQNDLMTQNSFYIIGDCYLHLEQFTLSAQSFSEASKMDFNEEIKEDALFNYAKLQYATSSSPFNLAIQALENYINAYPHSSRSEEATAYLSSIYLSTKNYAGAIKSLENITSKSPELLRAYQRCTYFRGLELINIGKNRDAIAMFNKSLTYSMNKEMRISTLYWRAEAEYRNENFKDAFFHFQNYHQTDGAKRDENYKISFYSLGYAAFKQDRYSAANSAFATFIKSDIAEQDPRLMADALVRMGDVYYMEKNLSSAINYYEKCENMKQENIDYALYQQAKCHGYLKNDNKKIDLLQKLINNYPRSNYNDDAEYELATTYLSQNNYVMAISSYKDFINKHPKSRYIRQAYNKMAQAYLNTGEEDVAIKTYKHVIENYPGSQEAKDALANLETIYTEQGNTVDFFDYIRRRNMNISDSRQDSVTYKAAENKYLRGDCASAIQSFDTYINQFPDGIFIASAYFYKAECEYGMNQFEQALWDYEHIITRFQTEYNETAIRKSASILYNKQEYAKALNYYQKLLNTVSNNATILLAQTGIMYCSYKMESYRDALNAAKAVLTSSTIENDLISEAKLIAGRSAIELAEYSTARGYLEELANHNTNDFAAEAAYLGCLIEFKLKNYDACEKKILDMLSTSYSSGAEYWFASVFILYGDLYAAKENYFQARHTYQSIVDNYEGDDLKDIALQRLKELDALEGRNQSEENPEFDEE